MGVYENQITAKMEKLGLRSVFVSGLASQSGISGASEASLSKALSGQKDLPQSVATSIDNLLTRFVEMADCFLPYKIRFDNIDHAWELLTGFESGKYRPQVITDVEQSIIPITPFWILERNMNELFESVDSSGTPKWTSNLKTCAAFSDAKTAVAVRLLLSSITKIQSITNTRRPKETIFDRIDAFGFKQEGD